MKYLIYLPWRRETNAFTVIEDASPSHTNTHTHTRIRAFWLKVELESKARVKLIFLKQNGNTERSGRGICLGKAEKYRRRQRGRNRWKHGGWEQTETDGRSRDRDGRKGDDC